jgi:hypothetical protein
VSNFSALLDACVIFPFSLSNILLEAAYKGLYRVHFSDKILDEAIRNRVKRGKMNQVAGDNFRAALVRGFSYALVEAPTDLEGAPNRFRFSVKIWHYPSKMIVAASYLILGVKAVSEKAHYYGNSSR